MAEEKKLAPSDKVVKLSDTVEFNTAYPKEFKGKKYMKEGKTYKVHRLHAERLEKKGIGKIK